MPDKKYMETRLLRDGNAVKIGEGLMARWYAIDAIQSIYAEPGWDGKPMDTPLAERSGCVKVATMGDLYGRIVACFDTMPEAQAAADHYAHVVWGYVVPTCTAPP